MKTLIAALVASLFAVGAMAQGATLHHKTESTPAAKPQAKH